MRGLIIKYWIDQLAENHEVLRRLNQSFFARVEWHDDDSPIGSTFYTGFSAELSIFTMGLGRTLDDDET